MQITSLNVHGVTAIEVKRRPYGTNAFTIDITLICGENRLTVYAFPDYAAGADAYIEPRIEVLLNGNKKEATSV